MKRHFRMRTTSKAIAPLWQLVPSSTANYSLSPASVAGLLVVITCRKNLSWTAVHRTPKSIWRAFPSSTGSFDLWAAIFNDSNQFSPQNQGNGHFASKNFIERWNQILAFSCPDASVEIKPHIRNWQIWIFTKFKPISCMWVWPLKLRNNGTVFVIIRNHLAECDHHRKSGPTTMTPWFNRPIQLHIYHCNSDWGSVGQFCFHHQPTAEPWRGNHVIF